MPFGWVDNSAPFITAANLEKMFNGGADVFTPEQFGAVRNGSTDDTAAIQSAINAAVTYAQANQNYAEVWFSPGIYQCTSATTKGGATAGNAQITIPIITTTTSQKVTLVLRGIRDSSAFYHWNQTVAQTHGACIRTTLTGLSSDVTWLAPSIIGGPTAWTDPNAGGGASFSNMLLVVDGLTILAPWGTTGPSLIGLDAGQIGQCNVGTLCFLTDKNPTQMIAAGPSTNGLGIALRMPQIANNDNCNVSNLSVEGWSYALYANDHVVAQRVAAIYCTTALYINNQPVTFLHGINVQYMSVEGGTNVVTAAGSGGAFPLNIQSIDTELQTGTDFVDTSNTLYGSCYFADGSGRNPTVSGCLNLLLYNQVQARGTVTAPTVPATTVSLINPFARNAHISITAGASTCAVTVDGVAQMTIPSAGVGSQVLAPFDPIVLTYTSAPTWKWILF